MKNIGVDIDGVIVNTALVYLDYIEKVCGRKFSPEQVTSYFFEDCIEVSPRQAALAMEKMIGDCIWDEIPFYEGALESLREMGEKHNLYIVTSRPPKAVTATRKWVRDCSIPAREVIFTDMESKLRPLEKRKIKLDYFIEDRWEFASEIASSGATVFLVDRPWNRDFPVNRGIIRVKGLKDAADHIFEKVA